MKQKIEKALELKRFQKVYPYTKHEIKEIIPKLIKAEEYVEEYENDIYNPSIITLTLKNNILSLEYRENREFNQKGEYIGRDDKVKYVEKRLK